MIECIDVTENNKRKEEMYMVDFCHDFSELRGLILALNKHRKTIISVTQGNDGYTVIYK